MFFLQVLLAILLTSAAFGQDANDKIEGEYFLVLKDGQGGIDMENFVGKLESDYIITWNNTFELDSVRILYVFGSEENVNRVSELPEVDFVEQNAKVQGDLNSLPLDCHKILNPRTWALDRIDQRTKPLLVNPNNPLNDAATYTLGPYRGAGVVAYVLDSGIEITHPDFNWQAFVPFQSSYIPELNLDLHGHGTYVAGIIGSQSYGVARGVLLMSVKVLDKYRSGTWASILEGMTWVHNDHKRRERVTGKVPKSVVNMSFSGFKNLCVNYLVKLLHKIGVVVVVSAGNRNSDACLYSPASAPQAITVAASDMYDKTVQNTNWGKCVDIFAPGRFIESTHINKGTHAFSGTSAAAPHVAGVVALKLSKETKSPKQITNWLLRKATTGTMTFENANHAKSPNKLLFMECLLDD